MSTGKRIIFDITTSSHWGGPVVGIVRVEQELARCLKMLWHGAFTYSIYDRYTKRFYAVNPHIAIELISSHSSILYGRTGKRGKSTFHVWRHPRRAIVVALHKEIREISISAPYGRMLRWVNKLLKRPKDQKWLEADMSAGRSVIRFDEAVSGPLIFSDSDVLVSAGLDWDHKDIEIIWRLKEQTGCKYVGVCYDMIPWHNPEYVIAGYAHKVQQYFIELGWAADLIVAISEDSRLEFCKFCDEFMIPRPATSVFELGAEIPEKSSGELRNGLDVGRFVLYVSTIEARKNHRLLVHIWDYLIRKELIPEDFKLVFVGRLGWGVGDLLQEIATNKIVKSRILLLQDVSDRELALLYDSCRFTVMPSFYEGYGLPVVESLSRGRACVTSDRGALSHLGGDLVERIDPFDFCAWARRLTALICDDAEIAAREAAISARYRVPAWDEAAAQFADAIKARIG